MDWIESSRRSFIKQLGAAGAAGPFRVERTGIRSRVNPASGAQALSFAHPVAKRWPPPAPSAWPGGMRPPSACSSTGDSTPSSASMNGRMEVEGVPIPQYELLAKHFNPKPNAARDWARLAKRCRPEVHGHDHQAPRRLLPL